MRTVICFTLLFMFISLSRSKICQIRTSSNTKDVCCADYEKKENDCIACLKGFTSYMGQNCYPCMKNTYGERCRYECQCSDFEVCDNVEGCVNYESTTGISVFATSSTSVQRSGGKTCGVNTKWGTKKVCCADFEENGKGCIACSSGYTSMMGQKCRPCQNNTYGERCKYECVCSRFERCDLANGCVSIQPVTDTSEYITTHDITSPWTGITGTDSEIDNTTIDGQANGKSTDDSFEDLLSRKIVTYYTITLMVVVPGLCLCMVFYKHKLVTKKKKPAIIHSKIHSISNNSQIIGMKESLYDNIDETEILGLIERIKMPPHNILIGGSNNTVNGEDTPCFKEGQYATKQDHPVIKISPPTIKDYITEATVHRIDSGLSDNDDRTLCENGNALLKDTLCLSYPYDIPSVNVISTDLKRCLSNETGRLSKSCDNLNIEDFKLGIFSETNCKRNLTEDSKLDSVEICKAKSESFIV